MGFIGLGILESDKNEPIDSNYRYNFTYSHLHAKITETVYIQINFILHVCDLQNFWEA